MRRLAQIAGICQTAVLLSACVTGFTALTLVLLVSCLTSFVLFESLAA